MSLEFQGRSVSTFGPRDFGKYKCRLDITYDSVRLCRDIAKNGLKFLDSMVCSGVGAERLGIFGEVAKKILPGIPQGD